MSHVHLPALPLPVGMMQTKIGFGLLAAEGIRINDYAPLWCSLSCTIRANFAVMFISFSI
jgi:hypothetical protein